MTRWRAAGVCTLAPLKRCFGGRNGGLGGWTSTTSMGQGRARWRSAPGERGCLWWATRAIRRAGSGGRCCREQPPARWGCCPRRALVWRMPSASGIHFMVRTRTAPCASGRTAQDMVRGESGWRTDLTYWCRLAMASGEVVGRRPLVLPTSSCRTGISSGSRIPATIASVGRLVLLRCVVVVPATRRRSFLYIHPHRPLKPRSAALRRPCGPVRVLDRMSTSRTPKKTAIWTGEAGLRRS